MKLEKIIEDVIEDYKKNSDSSLDSDKIGKALNNSISPFETELEMGEVYALCMECIYYLVDKGVLIDDAGEDEVELLVKEFFLKDLDDILAKSEPYKWIPKTLEKVLQMSYTIFEKAKESYLMPDSDEKNSNVDNLFSQMLDAKKELDSLKYIYRRYNEILGMYEKEISESQLDIDMIKGNKLLLSFRMADYIETGSMNVINEKVDFSVNSPFSMPNNLFK